MVRSAVQRARIAQPVLASVEIQCERRLDQSWSATSIARIVVYAGRATRGSSFWREGHPDHRFGGKGTRIVVLAGSAHIIRDASTSKSQPSLLDAPVTARREAPVTASLALSARACRSLRRRASRSCSR
eukprot:6178322-Pleurochrysis_carterae.AAC.1